MARRISSYLITGETIRISVVSDGTQGNGVSYAPSISADGTRVAFTSSASNLVAGDTNNRSDIFVHDLATSETVRVSVASDGTQGNFGSDDASLSADGTRVAFESSASNLVAGDTNNHSDIFVHDLTTGQTVRVSLASNGMQGNGESYDPSISADGTRVAFESFAGTLVAGDTNGNGDLLLGADVFVHDLTTGQTVRVSVASDGTQSNHSSRNASLSADGTRVAFGSYANNLVAGDTNGYGVGDVFVHDLTTTETVRVSVASDGTEANNWSWYLSLSADGTTVAFWSNASNLVADDTNGAQDVFVHYLGAPGPEDPVGPEIAVSGNGSDIADDDDTPDAADGTAFGNVLLGATVSHVFTINNLGGQPLTITNFKVPAGFTLVVAPPASIPGGGSAQFEVKVDASKLGGKSGQITFDTNDTTGGENKFNFALSATVVTPEIDVTGNNVSIKDGTTKPSASNLTDFGNVEIFSAPVVRIFTVKNTGTADLDITGMEVTGASFTLLTDLTGTTIAPGGTATFDVQLDPQTFGAATGTVRIFSNDLDEATYDFAIKANVMAQPEILVEGNGQEILINATTPDVADDTDFGQPNLGDTGPGLERTFTVTNTGNAPLTLTGLKLPKGFILVEGLSGSIPPGDSDTFTVKLDTSKAGTFTGQITFTTNDPDEKAFKFAVKGVVTQPEIDLFGNGVSIKDGSKKAAITNHTLFDAGIGLDDPAPTRTFTIFNNGTGDLNIGTMNVSGPFTLLDDLSNTTIAAGDGADFRVELVTSAAGTFTGTVTINNNDANEAQYDFVITGTVGPRNIVGFDAVDDVFVATLDPERFDGKTGSDTVSYDGAGTAVVASLMAAGAKKNAGFAAGDLYTSIENLIGSAFNDTLTGDAGSNVLEGGAGADKLDGGAGSDTASYANATAGVTANLATPAGNGAPGSNDAAGDTYKNIENLLGSAFADVLTGDKKANVIDGGAGDDTLVGGGGLDTLIGGLGADTFRYNSVKDIGSTIADFGIANDKIGISKSGFKITAADNTEFQDGDWFLSGTGTGSSTLPAGFAPTVDHGQFLFNTDTNQLWWDSDGTGKAKAILLLKFDPADNLTGLTAHDFDLL